jgi:hypothetical protein
VRYSDFVLRSRPASAAQACFDAQSVLFGVLPDLLRGVRDRDEIAVIFRKMAQDRGHLLSIPVYKPRERAAQKGVTMLFDCTWPGEWSREWEVPVKATFDTIFGESVRLRVLDRWRSYGFNQ